MDPRIFPAFFSGVGGHCAFAALTTVGALGFLAHMLVRDPVAWALRRVATGICVAGCYTIIRAWLQSTLTIETQGRAMGTYRLTNTAAALGAPLLIGVLEPTSYAAATCWQSSAAQR